MNTRTPIFVGNWKMNKLLAETGEFTDRLSTLLADAPGKLGTDFEVALAPSAAHLTTLAQSLRGTGIELAAQNCGGARFGAYTGEVSPAVLKELDCRWVIVGHSERRHVFKEEDFLILSRVKAAIEEGLNVILCVGEILQDRKVGKTFKVVESQLSILKQHQFPGASWSRLAIAYEPVWAIGTGENASPQQAQEVHAFIREWMAEKSSPEEAQKLRILYGGSVKPDNAAQIMAQKDVDGLLVGTSSLDAAVFAGVIKNGLKSRT